MGQRFAVYRESEDRLSKRVWWYWLDGTSLYLDEYNLMQRKTTRHKYRTVECFDRIDRRNNTYKSEDDFNTPVDVKVEVVETVRGCIFIQSPARRIDA